MSIKQSRLTEGYIIDTCSLIDIWRRFYPQDVFPGLWVDVEKLVKQNLLIAPREVFNELKNNDDELFDWAKEHQNMFIDLDEELLNEVSIIISQYPKLIDPTKTDSDADPFIIALAKNRNWTVITSENPSFNLDHPKIPDV